MKSRLNIALINKKGDRIFFNRPRINQCLGLVFLFGFSLSILGVYGSGFEQNFVNLKLDQQRIGMATIVLCGLLLFLLNKKQIHFNRVICTYLTVCFIWFANVLIWLLQGRHGLGFSVAEGFAYFIVPLCFCIGYRFTDRNLFMVFTLAVFIIACLYSYLELFTPHALVKNNIRNLIEPELLPGIRKFGRRIFDWGGGPGNQASPNAMASHLMFLSVFFISIINRYKRLWPYLLSLYAVAMIATENRAGIIFLFFFILTIIVLKRKKIKEFFIFLAVFPILLFMPLFFGNQVSISWLTHHDHLQEFRSDFGVVFDGPEIVSEQDRLGVVFDGPEIVSEQDRLDEIGHQIKLTRTEGAIVNTLAVLSAHLNGFGPLGCDKLSHINPGFIWYDVPGLNFTLFFENGVIILLIFGILFFVMLSQYKCAPSYIKAMIVVVILIFMIHFVAQSRHANTWLYFLSFMAPLIFKDSFASFGSQY